MFSGDGYSKMFGDALGADEEVGEPVGCNVGLTIIRIWSDQSSKMGQHGEKSTHSGVANEYPYLSESQSVKLMARK